MNNKSQIYILLKFFWNKYKLVRIRYYLAVDHIYDLRRFALWSHGIGADKTQDQNLYSIYKSYHGVEKGLSLTEPRPNFGLGLVSSLVEKINSFSRKYEFSEASPAVSALESYRSFNAEHNVDNLPLNKFLENHRDNQTGGTHQVLRSEIEDKVKNVGPDFFWSRHSIRQYSNKPVSMDSIRQAVDMARKTPSVCNRQGVRVHVFENAQDALDWQPGNRGFGHLASRALVVTADLQAFSGTGERNQPFIDGGMFAMSILYALHSLGLGACPLAWSTRPSNDVQMRKALDIPSNEVVIMMISVGHLPETLNVAKSYRRPLRHYLRERPSKS